MFKNPGLVDLMSTLERFSLESQMYFLITSADETTSKAQFEVQWLNKNGGHWHTRRRHDSDWTATSSGEVLKYLSENNANLDMFLEQN